MLSNILSIGTPNKHAKGTHCEDSRAQLFWTAIQVSAHVRRIETVEKELKALTERTAEKNDVTKLRTEMKQLYDGLHIGMVHHSFAWLASYPGAEFLDLRAHVWGLRTFFLIPCSSNRLTNPQNKTFTSSAEKPSPSKSHLPHLLHRVTLNGAIIYIVNSSLIHINPI